LVTDGLRREEFREKIINASVRGLRWAVVKLAEGALPEIGRAIGAWIIRGGVGVAVGWALDWLIS